MDIKKKGFCLPQFDSMFKNVSNHDLRNFQDLIDDELLLFSVVITQNP
jgi:hypothetical protein